MSNGLNRPRRWTKKKIGATAARAGGGELPERVADKQRRIAKVAAAKAAPEARAERNFTAPDSRIMRTGKEFVQAYHAQVAVDSQALVIVAQSLSSQAGDGQQLKPMVTQIKRNTGRQVRELSADGGYCSEGNLAVLARYHIRGYVATGRQGQDEARRSASAGAAARARW